MQATRKLQKPLKKRKIKKKLSFEQRHDKFLSEVVHQIAFYYHWTKSEIEQLGVEETKKYLMQISKTDYEKKKFQAGLQGVEMPNYEFDDSKPKPKNADGKEVSLTELNRSMAGMARSRQMKAERKARQKQK